MAGLKFGEVKRTVLKGLAAVTLLGQPVGAAAAAEAEAEEDDVYNFVKFYLVSVVAIWSIGSLVLRGSGRLGHWLQNRCRYQQAWPRPPSRPHQLQVAARNPAGPLTSLATTAVIGAGPTAAVIGAGPTAAVIGVGPTVRDQGGAAADAPMAVPVQVQQAAAPAEVSRGSGSILESSRGEASGAAAAAADEEQEPVEVAPLLRRPQFTYSGSQPVGLGV